MIDTNETTTITANLFIHDFKKSEANVYARKLLKEILRR